MLDTTFVKHTYTSARYVANRVLVLEISLWFYYIGLCITSDSGCRLL